MSLVCWLPLIKDLINNGVGEITTSGTPTFSTGGKIGNCMTGNDITITVPSIANSKVWSVCFWGYAISSAITGNWTLLVRVRDSGSHFRFEACPSTYANGIYCYSTHNNASYAICTGGMNAPSPGFYDQWCHVCVTCDGTTLTGYYNGVVRSTWSYTGTGAITGIFDLTNNAKCKKNDFRVYNHCLSAKEVAEIAKSLVLHYPLSNNGSGVPSLYDFESVASKWTNEGETSVTDYTDSSYGNVLKISSVASKRIYRSVSNVWTTSGGKYTVSFLAKASSNGATCDMSRSLADFTPTFTLTTDWKRYSGVITLSGTATAGTLSFRTLSNVDYYITQIKLESGEIVTPWTPNSSEPSYNKMGYDSTTEYDVSGYGYNGTRSGTITWISDTPRYSVSTHFVNGSYIMSNTNCPNMLSTDALTVNLWVKPTTWGTPVSCTEGGGWNFEETGSGLQFQFYVAAVGYKPAKCSITGASLQDGKWHMLTGTFSSANKEVKFYIDGALKATTSTGSANGCGYANNRLIVSGEAQSTTPASSTFVGEESDLRIYGTTLSDSDILELYNTSASLTNNGRLLSYQFVES